MIQDMFDGILQTRHTFADVNVMLNHREKGRVRPFPPSLFLVLFPFISFSSSSFLFPRCFFFFFRAIRHSLTLRAAPDAAWTGSGEQAQGLRELAGRARER